MGLFDIVDKLKYNVQTPLFEIDPHKISVEQIDVGTFTKYQKLMSKAIWRPAPGRKLAFLVTHEQNLLGILFLASPVIRLSVRDEFLGIDKEKHKGTTLRSYMDISQCVGAQPISWHWNVGKLLAMIAYTLTDFVEKRYPDDKLIGLVTSGLNGKASQYNRIYKFLGYTKGYGHEHITDEQYTDMLDWMAEHNVNIPSCRMDNGSNFRMRRIAAYRKASGDKSITLVHGKKRGVYYHDAVDSSLRQSVIDEWYSRWGLPRYLAKHSEVPPYTSGVE